MQQRTNRRGFIENYVEKRHLKLPELKEAAIKINHPNKYIYRDDIPAYPQPKFQFCAGGQPVMRVFETVLYKQEIMYSVLVHSPNGPEDFSQYPLLAEDQNAVCFFKDGRFIWRSEAMCGTHGFKLIQHDNNLTVEGIPDYYYVWDNVAIAFHVGQTVLKFDVNQLRQNLKSCKRDSVTYNYREDLTAEDPEAVIRNLWPEEEEDVPCPSRDDEAALPQPPS
ncbi:uncharacterized protein LOC144983628 isoform X2 [Oryzias latipes]